MTWTFCTAKWSVGIVILTISNPHYSTLLVHYWWSTIRCIKCVFNLHQLLSFILGCYTHPIPNRSDQTIGLCLNLAQPEGQSSQGSLSFRTEGIMGETTARLTGRCLSNQSAANIAPINDNHGSARPIGLESLGIPPRDQPKLWLVNLGYKRPTPLLCIHSKRYPAFSLLKLSPAYSLW